MCLLTLTWTFLFSEKKLEYNTVQLLVYIEKNIYVWWIYKHTKKHIWHGKLIQTVTKNAMKIREYNWFTLLYFQNLYSNY